MSQIFQKMYNSFFGFARLTYYRMFKSSLPNAAHIVHSSISCLKPFTYFRIIVSLEMMVGVSSHKPEVSAPFCVMSSSN